MSIPTNPVVDTAIAEDSSDLAGTLSPLANRRLLPSLAIQSIFLFACYAGLITVFLPNQIAEIDAAHKVGNLAIVTTVSFVFTLFTQPIVGTFSDRTRSRFGRRAPWMVIGVVIAAILMIGLGSLGSIVWITIFWVVIQVSLNALQGPLTAITPDRFPRKKRGIASAMIGLGTELGAIAGVVVAGALAKNVGVGYTSFGIAVLVVTLLFVLFNRDWSSKEMARLPFSWRTFASGFWVNPRKHPDFAWAFAARFFFILGYFVIFGYQLFILTDYIHLSLATADVQVGVLAIAGGVTTIVSVVLAGFLSDRLGRRKVFIYLASVFMVVGLLMPLLMPTLSGMIIMSVINGFGFGLYFSCDTALMTEVLPGGGADAGKDLGILNVATNIPQSMSAAVAALLISFAGGYSALFVFGMICVAIAALVIIPIKSVR